MLTLAEIKATAPNLFERAMTTTQWVNENISCGLPRRLLRKVSRIQLAWIGDVILYRVAHSVMRRRDEQNLVSAKYLFVVGEKLKIFSYLNCGNGEKTQYWTRCRQNNPKKGCGPTLRLISESVEALIAVIYLIHGYQRAAEFVTEVVIRPHLEEMTV